MSILYIGFSSKFIHTMPAGWFLAEYLLSKGISITERYHNVNEPYDKVLQEISKLEYDTLLLSVYIFNARYVKRLIKDLKKIHPKRKIIVGGPEVDKDFFADHIIIGEGEEALYQLLKHGGDKVVYEMPIHNLDDIPSPYTDTRLEQSKNQLIYYESSRGCPFHCSYCMASLSDGVRYFSLERVQNDLKRIVAHSPKVIKFTDRTFNMNTKRTNAIFQFILDNFSESSTCFHFEVGGDLFKESTLKLLAKMPVGLIQMEAGVQTLNPPSLKAIQRVFKVDNFITNIKKIIDAGNIHMHLDLIAGLPHDTLDTFIDSFDKVMALKPHMLQLGFLKLLKGTPIRTSYDVVYQELPPYEVISTPTISVEQLDELRSVEWVVDKIYNSGKFKYFTEYLMRGYDSYYKLFFDLSQHFNILNIDKRTTENNLFIGLLDFVNDNTEQAKNILKFDYLSTNNSRIIPHVLRSVYPDSFRRFKAMHKTDRYTLYQPFYYLPTTDEHGYFILKFDYSYKNPVNNRYNFDIIKNLV